jgi:hypothetical protein
MVSLAVIQGDDEMSVVSESPLGVAMPAAIHDVPVPRRGQP